MNKPIVWGAVLCSISGVLFSPLADAGPEVAQTPAPEGAQPEESDTGVSAEELQLLMKSLDADSASSQSEATTRIVTPSPAPQASDGAMQAAASALQSMNPDMSVILDTALAAFSVDEPMQRGGHDPSKTGFNLQQLEMSLSSHVDPYFTFNANLVFSQFGVETEEAYASTLALPWNLQARAGQFLTRFGRKNNTHPHSWHFVDQVLIAGKYFGSEGSRGLGAELAWLSPLPWYLEVVGSATDAAGECCARSFYSANDLGVSGPGDLLYTVALKQFFPLSNEWSLMWGLSSQTGPNATGNGNRSLIGGTDVYLRYRPKGSINRSSLSLELELMARNRQVPHDVLKDYGGYAGLVWQVNQRWETGVRGEWVSGLEDDPDDPEWTDNRMRYTVQATLYPSHFSRLRLQGSMDDPKWLDEPIWAAMLALEVVVGQHGAHAF